MRAAESDRRLPEIHVSSLVSEEGTQLLKSLTCCQMGSGTVGKNSHLALGLHGKSRMAARVFLMTGLRDIHFEQRSVIFPLRHLSS